MSPKSSTSTLYFPINWTHLFVGFPVSPRVKKAIKSALQMMRQDSDLQIEPVPPSMLYVLLEDFKVCPHEYQMPIELVLSRMKEEHSIFKLSPRRWVLEEKEGLFYIWLDLKDQYEQFQAIHREFTQRLGQYGFETTENQTPRILCAIAKNNFKINTYVAPKIPVWNNEIKILKRPQVYFPQRGYSCVGSIELPKESISSSDDLILSSSDELSEKDETRHTELLTLLETRLTERLTEKRHPLHKPNPHKKRRRSRKRGPRKEKG